MKARYAEAKKVHDQLLSAVARGLKESGWQTQEGLSRPTASPDLVVIDQEGSPYVIEVKAGSGEGHLGAVAQVEAYRNAIATELGRPVHAVLVLATDAPAQLADVARSADVLLLRADPGD